MVKDDIRRQLREVLAELGITDGDIHLEHPADPRHGDYSSNVALVAGKKLAQNPMDLAEKIKKSLEQRTESLENIEKIEVAHPGFINFWLSQAYHSTQLGELLISKQLVLRGKLKDQKILIEFAHPNTHKEFHIGHLRNIILGEAICRLLEESGAEVVRVNYQGDVGMHVAKALYGLKLATSNWQLATSKSLEEKAKLLGQAYAEGSKAYEEDEHSREEIAKINKQIYERDPEILPQWQQTRQWSLDYFDSMYKRLGTRFERLYFESEVYEPGREIVLSHIDDGIFLRDQGAVIFDGEKYGLHKRVFLTKDGNPTYESKEMGLGPLQYKEFPFDKAIHVVGPEQAGYFTVVFKALELVNPALIGKEIHLPYGLVQLKEGKMSSRMGNVVAGEWLLDETKRLLKEQFSDMSDDLLEQVAVGAVKYSLLKFGISQNINFSFQESISLEGNSGPYLQYTYARTQSVLGKGQKNSTLYALRSTLEPEELALLRSLHRFPEMVEEASSHFAPNLLCNYLFDLAQKFNLFYQKHKIIGSDKKGLRLALTALVGKILKQGFYLLGIAAPVRM